MLRIVRIERSYDPQEEFVLLQNHGVLKVPLRGHVLAHDDALFNGSRERMYSFQNEEMIPAGCSVALITGTGIDGWRLDSRGRHMYHVYWNRRQSVWLGDEGGVHLLNVVHTSRPRAEGLLISR